MYQLIRTLPDGTEKAHSPVKRLRDAAISASRVLSDNARVAKGDAQRFSAALARAPLGSIMSHSGYQFRIMQLGEDA